MIESRPSARILHWIVLVCIQAVFAAQFLCRQYIARLNIVADYVWWAVVCGQNDQDTIRRLVGGATKRPSHIAVILDDSGEANALKVYEDALRVVHWSVAAGLSDLTIYQPHGAPIHVHRPPAHAH